MMTQSLFNCSFFFPVCVASRPWIVFSIPLVFVPFLLIDCPKYFVAILCRPAPVLFCIVSPSSSSLTTLKLQFCFQSAFQPSSAKSMIVFIHRATSLAAWAVEEDRLTSVHQRSPCISWWDAPSSCWWTTPAPFGCFVIVYLFQSTAPQISTLAVIELPNQPTVPSNYVQNSFSKPTGPKSPFNQLISADGYRYFGLLRLWSHPLGAKLSYLYCNFLSLLRSIFIQAFHFFIFIDSIIFFWMQSVLLITFSFIKEITCAYIFRTFDRFL